MSIDQTSVTPAVIKGVDLTEIIKNNIDNPIDHILDLMINTGLSSNDIIAMLYNIGKQMGLEWLDLSELLGKIISEIQPVRKTFVGGLIWAVIAKWATLAFADNKISLDDIPKVIEAFYQVKYGK